TGPRGVYMDDFQSNEEYRNRVRKLEELRALGVEPYPHNFIPTHDSSALQIDFGIGKTGSSEEAEKGLTPPATVAGRLMLFRSMGKNAFGHIQDKSGRIQVMCNRDTTIVSGYTPQKC